MFGDHCLKTWFEDSHLCPYCREPVDSELRTIMPPGVHPTLSTSDASQLHAVLMRDSELLQRIQDEPELVNELMLERVLPSNFRETLTPPAVQSQERRGPPTNSEEGHRRQRPRFGSWARGITAPPASAGTRPGDRNRVSNEGCGRESKGLEPFGDAAASNTISSLDQPRRASDGDATPFVS